MSPTNVDLAQQLTKHDEQIDEHSQILTKLTTLVEAMAIRFNSIESKSETMQATLIQVGNMLARYEERDASTQKWVAVVVTLLIGLIMFGVGYFIHH